MQTDCTITQSISAMPVMAGGKPPFSIQFRRCSHASAQLSGSLSASARRISAQVAWGSMKVSFCSKSVGEGNAGEPAECSSFVLRELATEVALSFLPEQSQRLRPFAKCIEALPHKIRGQHFEEVEVGLLVDLRDGGGNADAFNQCRPFFVLRSRYHLSVLRLGDVLGQGLCGRGCAPFVETVGPMVARNVWKTVLRRSLSPRETRRERVHVAGGNATGFL